MTPELSFDPHMDIDTKRVPKGATNVFKARYQIAAGSEQTLWGWLTINKNVDCISYIYHNQQRFVNYIWDDGKGIGEHLIVMNDMALENRLMLERILKGGDCVVLVG